MLLSSGGGLQPLRELCQYKAAESVASWLVAMALNVSMHEALSRLRDMSRQLSWLTQWLNYEGE